MSDDAIDWKTQVKQLHRAGTETGKRTWNKEPGMLSSLVVVEVYTTPENMKTILYNEESTSLCLLFIRVHQGTSGVITQIRRLDHEPPSQGNSGLHSLPISKSIIYI